VADTYTYNVYGSLVHSFGRTTQSPAYGYADTNPFAQSFAIGRAAAGAQEPSVSKATPAFIPTPIEVQLLEIMKQSRDAGDVAQARTARDTSWGMIARGKSELAAEGLWHVVALPCLREQESWFWNTDPGTPPLRVGVAFDARFAADAAEHISWSILTGDYARGLQLSAAVPADVKTANLGAGNVRAALAFLDEVAQGTGLTSGGGRGASLADVRQPFAQIVYVSACRPLVGDMFEKLMSENDILKTPCLLKAEQLNLYAGALLDLDFFTPQNRKTDRARAINVLQYLLKRYPDYPQKAQIESLLSVQKVIQSKDTD
jgi:hypothetical protein